MNFNKVFNDIATQILPVFRKYRNNIKCIKIKIKEDKTLLTQADIEIQNIIVETIQRYDNKANFIAEEKDLRSISKGNKFTWVIDPIDGTRPFTIPSNNEFCCAIGVLENGFPVASMIFLPEICKNGTPILAIALTATNEIYVNGTLYNVSNKREKTFFASTTRGTETVSKIEKKLVDNGMMVKNRTTSQSIDMLRTAINISPFSDIEIKSFDLFYREEQKIWDGVPGMCFNRIVGKKIVDLLGNEIIPFSDAFLNLDEPISPAVIVAYPDEIERLLQL